MSLIINNSNPNNNTIIPINNINNDIKETLNEKEIKKKLKEERRKKFFEEHKEFVYKEKIKKNDPNYIGRKRRKRIKKKINKKNNNNEENNNEINNDKEKDVNNQIRWQSKYPNKVKEVLLKAMNSKFIICIDLSYNEIMNDRELLSLSTQLQLVYRINKKNENKINFYFTNIKNEFREYLNKRGGTGWMCHFEEKEFYQIEELILLNKPFIYLSPDAEEELEEVSDDYIYIIGGLVDRQVKKKKSLDRIDKINNIMNYNNNNSDDNKKIIINAKKLPLKKNLKGLQNPNLNVNTVVEILSYYMDMKIKNWEECLNKVIPKRNVGKIIDN